MDNNTNTGNLLLYRTGDGQTRIEVILQNDTVWLTADQMADLFQRNKSTISRHIKNVFEQGELQADSTVAFFATVQQEGKRQVERNVAYYNLDMIISIGYRVNSLRGVQFRMWATQKANAEYDKYKERTRLQLSPVEIHFLENFEKEQKRISTTIK